jgi:flagellar basal-body rod modification protein FlgD
MDAVGGIAQNGQGASGAPNAFSSLDSEQFVKIIFTELGNQDPLAPSDSKALLEQLSSLRSIQSDIDMSDRLKGLANQMGSMVAQNEFASASQLIGKTVAGQDAGNERIQGRVKSVTRTDAGSMLKLEGGKSILMSRLGEVLEVAAGSGS